MPYCPDPAIVTVNSRAFDGTIRKSWNAEIVESGEDLLLLKGIFDREIEHTDIGLIRRGTISYEYFWPKRWYNVFRFHEPDGAFRGFYCNVSMPPVFADGVLDYVDLDIDIVTDVELNIAILDEEEFRIRAVEFGYPKSVLDRAAEAIEELVRMIENRKFPFDQNSRFSDLVPVPFNVGPAGS